MSWLSFALLGYFFNAFATLIDKHLLSHRLPNAVIYAFYTGILSAGVLVLAPFGFSLLPARVIVLAFAAGISFVVSFYFFYRTLSIWEASRVSPLVGIFSTIGTLLLSQVFLGEQLTVHEIFAFIFLLGAGLILVLEEERGVMIRWDVVGGALVAAFFLSVMFFLSKIVFLSSPFISGFIWIRLGSALGALCLLLPGNTRKIILHSHAQVKNSSLSLVVLNKVIGGMGFVVINYAVSLGSATLVNVLRASEYGFLFLLIMLTSAMVPNFVHEKISFTIAMQKVFGILLLGIGIGFLFM